MAARGTGDWHHEDVKAAVRKTGTTLTALGIQAGLPRHACSHACRGPYLVAEQVIAAHLGLSPRQIWPSRFYPDGTRRYPPRRRFPNSTAGSEAGHCESREAS